MYQGDQLDRLQDSRLNYEAVRSSLLNTLRDNITEETRQEINERLLVVEGQINEVKGEINRHMTLFLQSSDFDD